MKGFRGLTRRALLERALLAGSLAAPAMAQGDSDPLRRLKPEHPRLILADADLDRIRLTAKEHALARRLFADLEKECDRLLSIPPVEYKISGGRLQSQTRRALDRITTLSLMFRLTGRDPWLRRAIMEMNAIANFRDWNPTRFIETAELMHAFSIGYDWLYNALSTEERTWIREALMSRGLDQALPIYQKQTWWSRERFNWNIVCNTAVAMAALAVGDELPQKSSEALRGAMESIPRALTTWNADGSWPEGPALGSLAARYASLFFASLESALGTDYGLSGFHGLDRAGRFRIAMTGPSGRMANFGDGPEDAGTAPEMFWMAKRFTVPAYAWSEQRQLERIGHADAYDIAWFVRDAKPPLGPLWPLDTVFHTEGIAAFRSSWDDPAAAFLAVKAGDSKAPHSHFDLGSFLFDAGGVRWAADIPQDGVRSDWHNVLMIEGDNQDGRGDARITRQESGADLSWVQVDLSKTSPKIRQWTRRIGLAHRQAVLIEDSIRADQPVEVVWGMTTAVDFSVNGSTAVFHRNGWNMTAEIRTPRHAVFDSAPVRGYGNYRRLIVRLPDKVDELELNIALIPWRDSQPRPKITAQFPA